ncbi:hypothetical protein OTU49_008655 [Cherax quadricarinatus]|uniref:Uncharacterized protein n=1 Tax=Cherax quadricarinatus TaxID=27406 RepID=A0AAW0WPJ0_CHEQU|nr:collagen alpha-1(XVI) chain-like [Cherax quadricarinatus]
MLVFLLSGILLAWVPQGFTKAQENLPGVDVADRPTAAPSSELLILDQVIESLRIPRERLRRNLHDDHNPSNEAQWIGNLDGGSAGRKRSLDPNDAGIAASKRRRAPNEAGSEEALNSGSLRGVPLLGNSTSAKRQTNYTPPCPPIIPKPSHYSQYDYLRYIAESRSGCVGSPCVNRCHHSHKPRETCPYDFESLLMRLNLLDERLQVLSKVETRLKIHAGLLLKIQNSPNFPGEPGETGPRGPKGQKGVKGPQGSAGGPGTCIIASSPSPSTGPVGPPGNKGATGPPGGKLCGCDGDRGETGGPGEDVTGPPGPRGIKGQKGVRGK